MDKKDEIKSALALIDNQIIPSDFHDDWQSAMRVVNDPARAKRLQGNVVNRLRLYLCNPFAGMTSIIIALMVCIIMLTNLKVLQEDPDANIVENRGLVLPLDPNLPWYGPTDDLLQVDVLKYETQLVTFAYYDPITMEIK